QAKDEAAAKPFIERLNTAVDSECQRIKALHLVMINILHTVIGEDANHEANFKALKKEAFPEEDLKSEDEHWNKAHASELKKIKTVEDHAVLLYRLYKRARQEAKKAAKAK
ncbi:MAG: hypothetical protein QF915_02640, partial [Candidatus Woesearchaeota archaeon]|nr:hypothetical protein [Candidatus Woesearchaeota archaeon]